MHRKTYVETLESRRLLSVTAATLAFPRTLGGQWTTRDSDGTTDAYVIGGSGTLHGNTGTKYLDHSLVPGNDPSDITGYFGTDSSGDTVIYGAVIVTTDTSVDPPVTRTTTEYYSPYHVQYPSVMVAGHVYSYSATLTGFSDTDSGTAHNDYTVKLASETLQRITVPAGTFMCYELDTTEHLTIDGHGAVTTSREFISPGNYPVKVIQTDGSDVTTTELTSTNIHRSPTKVAFVTQPSNGLVNAALTPAVTVKIEDRDNATVFDDTSTVTLKVLTGPQGGTVSGTTSVTAVSGTATFSNLKFSKPGSYTLRATDGDLAGDTSRTFLIKTTAAAKLEFGVQPTSTTTDTKIAPPVTVEIENEDGTVNTSDTSSVKLKVESGPVGGVLVGATTVTAVAGVAKFSDLSFDIPGTYTLRASDGDLDSAVSRTFTIISKAKATKLAFGTQPKTTVAGQTMAAVRVNVEYPGGAIVQNDTSTVTLVLASGPGALGGTLTARAVNGIATFSNLKLTKAGTYTLKATDGTLTPATSVTFTITPAAAAKLAFAVATPPSTVAGKSIAGVAVIVQDAFGNTVTTNTSKVTVALGSGTGTLGGTTMVSARAGIATFTNLSLTKVGSYSLKATDGALTSAKTNGFSITPAAATKLVLAASPAATTVAGKILSPATVFNIEDAFGNIVTSNTSHVTVSIATGGGTLTGTTSVAARAGVATFSTLVLKKAGAYTLKAVDGSLTSATTHSFTIVPAAASKLVFTVPPKSVRHNTAFAPSIAVTVEDAFGNVVKTDHSKVTIAIASGPHGAVLSGTKVLSVVSGVATFTGLKLDLAGSYTLKVTDGLLTSATSSTFTVT